MRPALVAAKSGLKGPDGREHLGLEAKQLSGLWNSPNFSGIIAPMAIPGPNQTVHLMTWFDVARVYWSIKGRNAAELALYTTDDLRRIYQATSDDLIRLPDGIINRIELVATIRWRVLTERINYIILFALSLVAAVAGVIAAGEGWRAH